MSELSVKEAAAYAGVGREFIRRRIIAGDIRAHKPFQSRAIGWRISRQELARFLREMGEHESAERVESIRGN